MEGAEGVSLRAALPLPQAVQAQANRYTHWNTQNKASHSYTMCPYNSLSFHTTLQILHITLLLISMHNESLLPSLPPSPACLSSGGADSPGGVCHGPWGAGPLHHALDGLWDSTLLRSRQLLQPGTCVYMCSSRPSSDSLYVA